MNECIFQTSVLTSIATKTKHMFPDATEADSYQHFYGTFWCYKLESWIYYIYIYLLKRQFYTVKKY